MVVCSRLGLHPLDIYLLTYPQFLHQSTDRGCIGSDYRLSLQEPGVITFQETAYSH
jgi:hypothetical protein